MSKSRLAVRFLLGAALLGVCWSAVAFQIAVARLYPSVEESGGTWAVDISPDPMQRDVPLAAILALGLAASLSRRASRRALIAGSVLFFGLESFWWFCNPRATFDSPEPLAHAIFGAVLATGVTLYRRGAGPLVIAGLATLAVCLRFGLWLYETHRLRLACDVDVLLPPTVLNNLFHGASWIHVMVLASSAVAVAVVARTSVSAAQERS